MAELKQGNTAGNFIVSEATVGATGVSRSRDSITVATGAKLKVGTVLGMVTASKEYVNHNPASSDGSEVAAGVLFDDCDASNEAKAAVALVRDCEVHANEIVWDDAITPAQTLTAMDELKAKGVIVRPATPATVNSADPITYDNA